jgi:hypothetical protein
MSFQKDNEGTNFWKSLTDSMADDVRRKQIEAGFEKEVYLLKDAREALATRGLEMSLETIRRKIRTNEIKAFQPSPRKTAIHKSELTRLLMGRRP